MLTGEVEVEEEAESRDAERKIPEKLNLRGDLGGESWWQADEEGG